MRERERKHILEVTHSEAGRLEFELSFININLTLKSCYELFTKQGPEWLVIYIDHADRQEKSVRIRESEIKKTVRRQWDMDDLKSGYTYQFSWEKHVAHGYKNYMWMMRGETEVVYFIGYKPINTRPIKPLDDNLHRKAPLLPL